MLPENIKFDINIEQNLEIVIDPPFQNWNDINIALF